MGIFRAGGETSERLTGTYNPTYEFNKKVSQYQKEGFSKSEAERKARHDVY
jgi:hypothetical protein